MPETLKEDEYEEKNRKKDFVTPEEVSDLSDTASIRNPFTDSSSSEWYVLKKYNRDYLLFSNLKNDNTVNCLFWKTFLAFIIDTDSDCYLSE